MSTTIDTAKLEGDKEFHDGCKVMFAVDQNSTGTVTMTMGRTILSPGIRNRHHYHTCDVTQYVAKGTIKFFLGEEKREEILSQGMFLYLKPKETHSFQNMSDTDTAEVIFNYANVPTMEAAETIFVD